MMALYGVLLDTNNVPAGKVHVGEQDATRVGAANVVHKRAEGVGLNSTALAQTDLCPASHSTSPLLGLPGLPTDTR